jgi:3-oxoacyl-[acyl-carrier protein] reductase
MRRLISRIVLFVSRLPLIVGAFKEIVRRGGYATHTIAVVDGNDRLLRKRILITGGSSGIGFAIAKKCLSEGARVVITGRDSSRLKKAAEDMKHPSLSFLEWDVSNTGLIPLKIRETCALLGGGIDMLVNNAGILKASQFPDVSEEEWDYVYSINSRGLFFLTQALCKEWMHDNGLRKVLNISSQGGFVGATYPYRMTKWDVAGLTQGLGIKMAPYGIIVNGIAPGIIATDMQPDCLNTDANVFWPLNPLKRFAYPEEIAELAAFLLSDTANFIVAQTIVCDGGFSVR